MGAAVDQVKGMLRGTEDATVPRRWTVVDHHHYRIIPTIHATTTANDKIVTVIFVELLQRS